MAKRLTPCPSRVSRLRSRAAVLAAGIGVSASLGAGVAAAHTSALSTSAMNAPDVRKAASGSAAVNAPAWVGPVSRYGLSARFRQAGGMWRSAHSGQDFAVPSGTSVVAVYGGTVVKAGGNGAGDGPAYGKAVVIRHQGGMYSQYAHLSRIDVRVGQSVAAGQRIALSGSTGNSSGPHLHFEIRTTPNYGSAVDPMVFLRSRGVRV